MGLPPTTSSHLSDQDVADLLDQYAGAVDSQFAKASMMRRWATVRSVRNTDTLIVRRVGRTTIGALTPGVRPDAAATAFGKASVTVDTVIIARDNQSTLNAFQADFAVRDELGKDHGKELGKFFDEAFLIAGMKGAAQSAPSGLNSAFGAGKLTTLSSPGDELDPDLLYAAMAGIVVAMQEEDIDTDECVWFIRPTQHDVLLNNDKLIDRDFSTNNGDFATGKFKTLKGVPVMATARLPNAAIASHPLSNTGNSNFYNVSATEAKVRALIIHPMSLLAGETIPLTSDIFYSKTERQWFIDSYAAFGVNVRRPDVCGAVRAA